MSDGPGRSRRREGTDAADGKDERDRAKDRQLELVERQAVGREGDAKANHDGKLEEDGEPL